MEQFILRSGSSNIFIIDNGINKTIKKTIYRKSQEKYEKELKALNILDKYQAGISIQIVQLQGVHPPKPVEDSFNEVNRAKQEQETLVNEARQEFNKEIYIFVY